LHLVGILFPHINDDARSKSHQFNITIINKWQKEKVTTLKIHKQCPLVLLIKVGWRKKKWRRQGSAKGTVGSVQRRKNLSILAEFTAW